MTRRYRSYRRYPVYVSKVPSGYVNSTEAGKLLRLSTDEVREIAPRLGGVKQASGRWMYPRSAVEAEAARRGIVQPPDPFAVRPAAYAPRALSTLGSRVTAPAKPWYRTWREMGIAASLTIGALIVVGAIATGFAPDTSNVPSPQTFASVPAAPAVTYLPAGLTCWDGWQSGSIGKRGACSHHGGVALRLAGSDGTTWICVEAKTPPSGLCHEVGGPSPTPTPISP